MNFAAECYVVGDESGDQLNKTINDEIFLKNNEHYSIVLHNKSRNRMVSDVTIAGNSAGSFVVNPHRKFTIDRPDNATNKFKCVRKSSISDTVLNSRNIEDFDTVKIVCKFEKKPDTVKAFTQGLLCETDSGGDVYTDNPTVGGTILSKVHSTRKYREVGGFPCYDKTLEFMYKLRVKDNDGFIYEKENDETVLNLM